MTWLQLYNYLNNQANKINNHGQFNWQEDVKVFDFATLEYYLTDFVELPDGKISLSVDTINPEILNGS